MGDFKIPLHINSLQGHKRTIVHIDIDCFYAQVEMNRNPELRDKPLGIQQKNIVVTCNYVARKFGVGKCMSIVDAYKCCPSLVLVSGEDLTHYRDVSNKVTALLQNCFGCTVERLGFDENFIDVSKLVTNRLPTADIEKIQGHIYGAPIIAENNCKCGCSERLIIGSQIASEMREQIFKVHQLTTCAGISYNKVLAKLVGEQHKPNQQTILFHGQVLELMSQLPSVRSIPGIGRHTAEVLKGKLNVESIECLQKASVEQLALNLGSHEQAVNLLKLSFGIDDAEVKQSSKPQSIGLEDAFKEIRTLEQVEKKLQALLRHLLELLFRENPIRSPGTIKVTVRKYNKNWQDTNKESRQCSLPTLPVGQIAKCEEKVMPLVIELFKKMVNTSAPFHLTLLGIAFTNLSEPKQGRASILTFMEPASKKAKFISGEPEIQSTASCEFSEECNAISSIEPPPGVDAEVFIQLPPDLQKEILADWTEKKKAEKKPTDASKGKIKNSIKNYFRT